MGFSTTLGATVAATCFALLGSDIRQLTGGSMPNDQSKGRGDTN